MKSCNLVAWLFTLLVSCAHHPLSLYLSYIYIYIYIYCIRTYKHSLSKCFTWGTAILFAYSHPFLCVRSRFPPPADEGWHSLNGVAKLDHELKKIIPRLMALDT